MTGHVGLPSKFIFEKLENLVNKGLQLLQQHVSDFPVILVFQLAAKVIRELLW